MGWPRRARNFLEPLTGDESEQVIANLLGTHGHRSVDPRADRDVAQGNPLFVEQMLSMLIDDGLVAQVDGRWKVTGDLMDVLIPPNISALLSARLDRLATDERSVLERGSVVGRVFWPTAVTALADSSEPVAPPLSGLRRKQLIEPTTSWFPDDLAYQFLHILIRDEAYGGILKTTAGRASRALRRLAPGHRRYPGRRTARDHRLSL